MSIIYNVTLHHMVELESTHGKLAVRGLWLSQLALTEISGYKPKRLILLLVEILCGKREMMVVWDSVRKVTWIWSIHWVWF